MFEIEVPELVVVLVITLLAFGMKSLPAIRPTLKSRVIGSLDDLSQPSEAMR